VPKHIALRFGRNVDDNVVAPYRNQQTAFQDLSRRLRER
jgi:hypothetical protein